MKGLRRFLVVLKWESAERTTRSFYSVLFFLDLLPSVFFSPLLSLNFQSQTKSKEKVVKIGLCPS